MVALWEPGTQYGYDSVVEYEGHLYKIIQPHRSQSDWTPPATPALWGKMSERAGAEHRGKDYRPQQCGGEKPQGGNYGEEQQQWHEQHSQKVDVHHEEQKKHWYDLDDKRKKELEVGGGLAAGLALLGTGYYAYHSHQKSEEEKKAQVWGLQKWLRDAQLRAEDYHRNGTREPAIWILVNGKNIPEGAILGGEEGGGPIYIARAFHEGGIQVGKAGPQFEKGGVIGYRHKEIQVGTYEVLIGNPRAVRWVETRGNLQPSQLGARPIEGGHEDNGTTLYIAQAEHKGGVCPGKASEALDGAYLPYGGSEQQKKSYRVLVYA